MAEQRVMGWVSPLQEPKRLNRFELLLSDNLRLTCNSCTLPNISLDPVEIHRMHNKYKISGSKVSYGDVTLKFYDFVDNSAANELDAWHKSVYNLETSLMGFPKDYKRDLTLLMYGPDHSVVESWLFKGAWPREITRPGLDWKDSQGVIEVTLNLCIDEARLLLSTTTKQ